jgi:hypothetical protein
MATIMLAGSAWGFQTGNLVLGQIVGWLLVVAALVDVRGLLHPFIRLRTDLRQAIYLRQKEAIAVMILTVN